jgi:hypothetical protein
MGAAGPLHAVIATARPSSQDWLVLALCSAVLLAAGALEVDIGSSPVSIPH